MNEIAIKVKNLSKHFGKVAAVDDISFAVEKAEIFGFLGPNGAGKTTTINIFCTLLGIMIAARMTSLEGFGVISNFVIMPMFF